MILKNSKGIERHFEIIFEIEKDSNKYIVYKDPLTGNVYSGKNVKGKLLVLEDNELDYLNKILEKLDS
ncbi:MAG: hypothetical protein E7161_03945 [Firmicutes bacterium]|nr:hypothetical protein [Bacillota bacterium]